MSEVHSFGLSTRTLEGDYDWCNGLGDGRRTAGLLSVGVVAGGGASTMSYLKIMFGFAVAHTVAQGFVWWFANV